MFNKFNKIIFVVSIFILGIFVFNNVQAADPPCTATVCIGNVGTTNITINSATITWTTNVSATSQVQYGLTTRYGLSTALNSNPVTSHSVTITGLNQSSNYNYQVISTSSGFTATSANLQFTTLSPPPTGSVIISGEAVSNITKTAATITWTTNVPATSKIEYGSTTRYGNPTPTNSTPITSHSITISGLNPGSAYNYRVVSTANGFTAQGENRQFNTLSPGCTASVCISNVTATNIATSGATITWNTNVPANSQVEYGPRAPIYDLRTSVDSNLTTSHSVVITGLTPGFTYNYRAVSTASGFTARSSNFQFITIADGTGGCGTSGQPACKPGQDQNYSFEIPNPLKGGADDFTSLVKILAQWIFNLAIPIAVAMIVYSGILFLTAAGDTAKVTKAKDVLKYAVIGLAIILIGSGFVTLIRSILELGGTGQPTEQGPGGPLGPNICDNGVCANSVGPCKDDSDCVQAPSAGAVGNKCAKDNNCVSGLKCKNTICQRPTGNLVGEPCIGGASCDVGLACDMTTEGQQLVNSPIDGQTVGSCFETSTAGGRIGDACTGDKDCISGFKCNKICQRKDGNLNDEVCLSTSNPSNCKSKACKTVGAAVDGVCVNYSGT